MTITSSVTITHSLAKRQCLQLRKVRRTETCDWIPTRRRIPTRVRDHATLRNDDAVLEVYARAADRAAIHDVVECLVRRLAVKPGIDEAHCGLAVAEAGVVQEGDDGRDHGRSRGGATVWFGRAVDDG